MEYDRNKIIGNGSKCYYPVGNKIWLCVFDNFGSCLKEYIHENEWYYMRDYKRGFVSNEGWEDMKQIINEHFEKEKSGKIPKYTFMDEDTKKLINKLSKITRKSEKLLEDEKNKEHF
jgi:hypothetical protein